MNSKFIICLFALLISLSVSNCYLASAVSLEEFKKTYNYLSANQILYYGESNLDNDNEVEKVIVISEGEYSFTKLLISKSNKIIASIEISEPYSKILNVSYKDILNLGYNQIIMEIYVPTYDRGLGETKVLSIVAYVDRNYKEIFNHEIEDSYRDNIEGWSRLIQWKYSIKNGKNAKIVFTNIRNETFNTNFKLPPVDKTEEYIWNGTEFKRVNWSIYDNRKSE